MNQEVNIYAYNDPALFLRDHWLKKKEKNPSFSIRSWAKSMNISSHGLLHQMVYGKRSIPKKYLPQISKSLNLNEREQHYLEALIDIQKSKDYEEKSFYLNKIKFNYEESKLLFREIDSFEMIRNPLHFYILEIISLRPTKITSEIIKRKLKFDFPLEEIKRAMETLLHLGFMTKVGPSEYARVHDALYTKSDIPSRAVKDYHQRTLDMAKVAIEKQDLHEREFAGTCLNLKKNDVKRAKEMIREFRKKFIEEFEASELQGDQTYQININLFAITEVENENYA
ncbi:MAG: TIGR02147 family protein [Bacteriovoracaceae bacterium]